MILQNCVKRIAHATEEISGIEAEIDRQAAVNEDAKLLMSMTGIEAFAAMLLVSEIGDITRFKTADRLRHDPQLRIVPSMPIILQMCAPKHATFV